MEVFISWSGPVSQEIAGELSGWLEHVVRGVDTFVSTQDIDAGERWEARLSEQLDSSHHAVLCITRDNQTAPWLLYEAGALGRGVGRTRVIPYTIGFSPQELAIGPLSRFQGVQSDRAGTWELVRTLNRSSAAPKDESFVREAFDLWWPRLEARIEQALTAAPAGPKAKGPSDQDLLLELREDMRHVLEYIRRSELGDLRKRQETIELLTRDPLTQLPNRRALSARASELHANNVPYAVALVDLDSLKMVNDVHGHLEGDRVIASAAAVLAEAVEPESLVARWGGDEFVVLFAGAGAEYAAKQMQSFVESLRETAGVGGLPVTASVGLSRSRVDILDVQVQHADLALFKAKRYGGDQVVSEEPI